MKELICLVGAILVVGGVFGFSIPKVFRAILGVIGVICLFFTRIVLMLITGAVISSVVIVCILVTIAVMRILRGRSRYHWW